MPINCNAQEDAMGTRGFVAVVIAVMIGFAFSACGRDPVVNVEEVTARPKAFVGSDTCKKCHLEHFDSWQMTLHSRGLQDAQNNVDAFVAEIDEAAIRADLAEMKDELTAPVEEIYIPKTDEILYTMGSQWQQRYVVKKEGTLYVAPIQYNIDTNTWVAYHEADWQERPWSLKCGGCHSTGLDLEQGAFSEPAVGCEACHGKGSWHAALPKTAVFEKRETIVNPSKMTMGVAVQICGSCHNRGRSTKNENAEWPVGYQPGKALNAYFDSIDYASREEYVYANEFARGHHQQYLDWEQSQHYKEGVTCTSCHFVHQIGMPPTRSQTINAGSAQCFECHIIINKVQAHSIHSFGNCIGCHMPRIVKSAVSGDLHSHVFDSLTPIDTIKNPKVPNSCQACHHHKDDKLMDLQNAFDPTGLGEVMPVAPGGEFGGEDETGDEAPEGLDLDLEGGEMLEFE